MSTEIEACDGQPGSSRREALGLALVAGAAMIATPALAQQDGHSEHAGHEGHGSHVSAVASSRASSHQAVIDAALTCVNRGEVCHEHCIKLLSSGDTSMRTCIRTVSAMLPMCTALAKLAALDSARLKELAKLCIDVCSDCETECRKHEKHHAACKACAISCADCIETCKALVA